MLVAEPVTAPDSVVAADPTACGCPGPLPPAGGSCTQPAEVAVEQPVAPETVQSQILTVCCGRLVVIAVHPVPVVLPQFLPANVSRRFCERTGTPEKPAYQSFASAVMVAFAACATPGLVPSWPRRIVHVVVPAPAVTCMTSLSTRMKKPFVDGKPEALATGRVVVVAENAVVPVRVVVFGLTW